VSLKTLQLKIAMKKNNSHDTSSDQLVLLDVPNDEFVAGLTGLVPAYLQ